jgi:hypothetical protein
MRAGGGVGQEIDFLNQPPRRFAAPRLDQGGEFAFPEFLCKAHVRRGELMTGLPELFLGLMIIGSITGLIVGVAVFLGRKERGTAETGKV